MRTNALNSGNNQSFTSKYLLQRHVIWLKNINTNDIEDTFRNIGIRADFRGKKLPAGLSYLAVRIAKKLNISLPAEFLIRKTPNDTIAQSWFFRDRRPHRCLNLAVQYSKSSDLTSIKRYDAYVHKKPYLFGSTHFLNIPLHEILHCDLYKKIGERYAYWHHNWDKVIDNKFSKIDMSPFIEEIKKKIGTYAAKDVFELHATYWAKEICRSLDSNLTPKYDPFKTPKIELSPLLREFIDKITTADYNGAKAVSRKAKKLQKTA